ncbi:SOS response-associated peptidase [Clostridium manihotivorum]|uniref:Abasic site processing protein n=1 Tax=Clostridium manihotivorum TaxID=2320868 RepID=A0A410DZ00_9CLOT|nr:SOS response-associated peptidase [Clostridium manihotivorum]QAA34288.1 SOS response-associated peptidase [Clostridium manihotivorum]
MCGRFYLNKNFLVENTEQFTSEHGEKLPSNTALVMTYEESETMKWGLPYEKTLVINARSESLFQKKMFSECIKNKRCVIPASWFYEWKNGIKYKISLEKEKVFYMAGIYNKFIDKNGEVSNGFVIITTASNNEMSEIHHRMPVMLSDDEKDEYLDPDTEMQEIKKLLKTIDDGVLAITADSGSEQLTLF